MHYIFEQFYGQASIQLPQVIISSIYGFRQHKRAQSNFWNESIDFQRIVVQGFPRTTVFFLRQTARTKMIRFQKYFQTLQVSWIRTRDIRVLAIGKVRYTQDTRFTPLHEEGNDVWALKIQETRMSDTGLYECQVSYHDDVEKKLKMPVKLVVLGTYKHCLFKCK